MKRCPKCNRTFSTETQKFCTHDGAPLVTAESHQGDTVRIDSSQIEGLDNAPTRAISRELASSTTGQFDPYKTILAPSEETKQESSADAGDPDPFKTVAGWQEGARGTGSRDTQELVSPAPTSTSLPPGPTVSVPSPPPFEPTPEPQTPQVSAPLPPGPATTPSAPLSEPQTPPSSSSAPLPPGPATMPSVSLSEPQTPPSSSSAPLTPGPATMPSVPLSGPQTPAASAYPSVPSSATLASVPLTAASGANAPSVPLLAPQPAIAGSAQAIQRPVKKSKLPLVLGILAVLLVLAVGAVGAAYFFLVIKPRSEKRPVITRHEPTPQPTIKSTQNQEPTPSDLGNTNTTGTEVPPYSPPAGAVQFVNSKKNLDGKLAEHYVDFSFYYPKSWQKDPKAGVPGARNFVKVERGLPPNYTLENFAVGLYASAGSVENDRAAFHALAEKLSSQFAESIGNYHKASEGETKVGLYDGYEFRFEGLSQQTDKGQFKIWGRAIFLPPVDGGNNGVTLLMLTTSLAPELKSVDDVGEKGDLPMLLQSFRFGKP